MTAWEGTMSERLERLRTRMAEASLDGLIVSKPANIHYLCGATGAACELLVTQTDALLLSNFVDVTENAETAHDVAHGRRSDPSADIAGAVQARRLRRVGLEAHVLTQETYARYTAALGDVQSVPISGL